jgi:hypothetical protein
MAYIVDLANQISGKEASKCRDPLPLECMHVYRLIVPFYLAPAFRLEVEPHMGKTLETSGPATTPARDSESWARRPFSLDAPVNTNAAGILYSL